MSISIVFLGTPVFSVPCLKALLSAGDIQVLGVITQPDRPAGRGQRLTPPPVKILAESAHLPVFQPKSLRRDNDLLNWLRQQQPDFLVTIAFGQILSQEVLDIPKKGTVNVHASLLPEYRGPNPIQKAIVDGKTETGLTTMLTDIGVDTGDMLLKTVVPITPDLNAQELHDMLSEAAGPLLLDTLRGLADGSIRPEPQDPAQATHAPKAQKEDALIDWSQPAQRLHDRIRGQQPWPGAVTWLDGQPVKILRSRVAEALSSQDEPGRVLETTADGLMVQTGQGALLLLDVQPAGKRVMNARDWANGALRDRTDIRFEMPGRTLNV